MAPVKISYIVSFSSQDNQHRACNLVVSDGLKCWLSDKADRTGKSEVMLQIDGPCKLAYIDIGAIWCANLEVRVGRSDWPQSKIFESLIPTVTLMSPIDCRLSRATTSTQMFSKKDFAQDIADQEWDRVQVICRQPYRKDVQFGLSFINIRSANSENKQGESTEITDDRKARVDTTSIKKHFFGSSTDKDGDGTSHAERLKYRLMKISGSAENGSEQEQSLTRTARLVLQAASNSKLFTPKHKPASLLPNRGLFSGHMSKKHDVPIERELTDFFPSLSLSPVDVDRVTVADLRHKFERKKRRKLTQEEKRTFSEMCQKYICDMFDENNAGKAVGKSKETFRGGSHQATVNKSKTSVQEPAPAISMCKANQKDQYQPADENNPTGTIRREKYKPKSIAKQPGSQMAKARSLAGKAGVKNLEESPSAQLKWKTLYSRDTHCTKRSEMSLKNTGNLTCLNVMPPELEVTCDTEILDCPIANVQATRGDKGGTARGTSNVLPTSRQLTLTKSSKKIDISASSRQIDLCREDSLTPAKNSDDVGSDSDCSSNGNPSKEGDVSSQSSLSYTDQSDIDDNRTAAEKVAAIQKAYQRLYNVTDSVSDDSVSASQMASQAKRRKLSKESLSLLQQFTVEIASSEDEGDSNKTVNTEEKTPTLSTISFCETIMPVKDDKICDDNANSLSLSGNKCSNSEDCSTSTVTNNTTPKSFKGKVYRMYHSASKAQQVGSTKRTKFTNVKDSLSDCNTNIQCPLPSTSKDCLSLKHRDTAGQQSTPHHPSNDQPLASPTKKRHNSPKGQSSDRNSKSKSQRGSGYLRGSRSQTGEGGYSEREAEAETSNRSTGGRRHGRKREATSMPVVVSDVLVCEKCLGEFPSASFRSHQAFCTVPSGNPPELLYDNHTGELLIDDSIDYAECPICMQRFPQDVLPVHASDCGL